MHFWDENDWISIKMSHKFFPRVPINNITAFVKIMAWCRPGDKPLSEPMIVSLLTHICSTRPEWVIESGASIHNFWWRKTYNLNSSLFCNVNKRFLWDGYASPRTSLQFHAHWLHASSSRNYQRQFYSHFRSHLGAILRGNMMVKQDVQRTTTPSAGRDQKCEH